LSLSETPNFPSIQPKNMHIDYIFFGENGVGVESLPTTGFLSRETG